MARRVSSPEFVGRGPELGALLDALGRAADGEFAAVFVGGDSGVGKSRLLSELARAAEARGALVLGGECVSYSQAELPYAPVRTALRGLTRGMDPGALEEVLGSGREELARLLPELGDRHAGTGLEWAADEPVAQARLFELVAAVLARLGDQRPLLLAIEDVHWADRSTLDLLSFLIADAPQHLLLACSYRSDEVHSGHRLRSFLAHHDSRAGIERVELRPFDRDELAEQLRGILGSEPDSALVGRLHERTEGNAFFTEELLAASAEGSELPASLRDALLLRIEVLGEPVQQVLRLAAAHGRVVPHRLLAAVSERPEWELHGVLREALAHHVLVRHDEESYAFRHALLQETVESDLLPGERVELHLALARALQDDPRLVAADGRAAAEVCAHWLGAGRPGEALAAAVRAGIEAEEVYAFAEASSHFLRALDLWQQVDDAEQRAGMDQAELYARAADAALISGDGPEAIRLLEAATETLDARTDPHRAASLRERLGRYLFMGAGDTEGAQRAFQEAIALLPSDQPRPELARALASYGAILMLRGRALESAERCEHAIAVARRTGARSAEAHALDTLGMDLATLGDRATGIDYLRQSMRMSEELADPYGLFRSYLNLSDALDMDGRTEESAELAVEGAARARESGMAARALVLEGWAATRMLKLGRMDEAERLTATALDLRPSLAKLRQCASRAQLEVLRGRAAEAEKLIRAAEEATPSLEWANWMEPLASSRVELELLRQRPDEARRLGKEALNLAADQEQVFYTARLHALGARACALVAERARAAGDEATAGEAATAAGALRDRIARLLASDHWRGPPPSETLAYREVCAAEVARAAGIATAADWATVAERWQQLGQPLEEAYARLREGECLVLGGERKRAEEAVAAGLRVAGAARWLRDELQSLAQRGRLAPADGMPARQETGIQRLGLTDRELAVLELVARGLTNRQIGEQLFMSQKTASVHVSRILAKLEVGSRVEAATVAQRLGIVR